MRIHSGFWKLSTLWGIVLLVLVIGVAGQGTWAAGADQPPPFLAGAAASNITPPLDQPVVGGWGSPLATHVHDELWARCLVLDNGETRLAFVVIDSLGASRNVFDAARDRIEQATDIPGENVMMSATHTHSSISARGPNRYAPDGEMSDYQKFLAQRISDGVRRAVNNLQPARIGWGSAEEPTQVFNRRYFMKEGTPVGNPFGGQDLVRMNPGRGNPNIERAAGPTDPEIAFLSVQTPDGQPLALLANYSLHYVGPRRGNVISADYFGVFADHIQKLLNADRQDPPFVAMMSNGTSADINNIDWLNPATRRWEPYEKMRQVGELTAQAVYEAYAAVEHQDWAPLDAAFRDLTLAVRKPTPEQIEWAHQVQAKPEDEEPAHPREGVYSQRVLQLAEAPEHMDIPLQAFRVGDGSVCAIPFEVFVEIGLEIKETTPLAPAFTISMANGSYGYLPTEAQHQLGGYETWLGTSAFEYQAADKITATLMEMLEAMAP